jgi:DNA polymerase (family 10)
MPAVTELENNEIADLFDELADLLEIQEANPFRVRAYRNAARVVRGHPTPMVKLLERGEDLTKLPGIGKDLASQIQEIVTTGKLSKLEDLRRQVPESLRQLMQLPSVGPKKAKRLWQELHITSLEELERAAKEGRLAKLEGFGEKSQENILKGIEQYRRFTQRFLLADADAQVRSLLEHMKSAPGLERIEPAGSYRRRKETVGDIDILAIARKPEPVMKHFLKYPKVQSVQAAGSTRGTVILTSGMQVDLRIVPRESYGAALCYFTGSKEHNIAIRKRGVERGLKISEYGVFREGAKTSKPVAGREEEEVFRAVGLPWIPPELRENRGEIESAEANRLPKLIELKHIKGDLQMHSKWSDGKNSIEEMVSACEELGYQFMAITDHSQALGMTGGLDEEDLKKQWKEIQAVQKRHPRITILKGLEVDILADGSLDLSDAMLKRLDVVIVSIHSRFQLPKEAQTRRVLKALQHPEVNIFAHPTARLINRRDPVELDMEEVLKVAAEHGVAVEVNAQPERLDLNDIHIKRALELGCKLTINTDAHSTQDLQFMRYGVDQARRGWAQKEDVINTYTLKKLESFLAKK